jgi:hypothetical protein
VPTSNLIHPSICKSSIRLLVLLSLVAISFWPRVSLLANPLNVQESVRELPGSNEKANSKYLTPGEIDGWVLEAKENEIIIARVATTEFDAILGLAKVEDDDREEVLFSKDEQGSNSQFYHRVKKAGKYKIRVHGYLMKGGGNYALNVERFKAKPIQSGEHVSARFDDKGRASVYFTGELNQNYVIDLGHSSSVFDSKGMSVPFDWEKNIRIKDEGEHLISLHGSPGKMVSGVVRPAMVSKLNLGDSKEATTAGHSLNIWEINAEPGQFQVISASRSKSTRTRLIYSPVTKANEKSLEARTSGPDMRFCPVASKGKYDKFAVVFRRAGRYELQVYSTQKTSVDVNLHDPTVDLATEQHPTGQLAIGDAKYYGFHAKAGDLFVTKLKSRTFDTVLRLFDKDGALVAENDDFKESRNSEMSQLIKNSGYYRWQVSSLGNGGGGDFDLSFDAIPKKMLETGVPSSSQIAKASTEYWLLDGKNGDTVYVNARSNKFRPQIAVFDGSGRLIGGNERGVETNSLTAIKFRSDGPITISVSSQVGFGGKYEIRSLDGSWGSEAP